MLFVSCLAACAYLILSPAFIEDHVHDNAGEAHVILNHHLELCLILLLLCNWKIQVGSCQTATSMQKTAEQALLESQTETAFPCWHLSL